MRRGRAIERAAPRDAKEAVRVRSFLGRRRGATCRRRNLLEGMMTDPIQRPVHVTLPLFPNRSNLEALKCHCRFPSLDT